MRLARLFLTLILISGGVNVFAQPEIQELIPELNLTEMENEATEDVLDLYTSLMPFNLNDSTVREAMMQNGLLSDMQCRELKVYTDRYGPILHLYELVHLPGFTLPWLLSWAPYICFETPGRGEKRRPRLRLEQSCRINYNPDADDGAGLRSITRLRYTKGEIIDARLVFCKGEGEKVMAPAASMRPEWSSGAITVRGGGMLRQLIIGDLQLQGGFGLRYGSGWSSWEAGYPLGFPFRPYRLITKVSSLENTALRGIGTELRKGNWRMTMVTARARHDGSLKQEGESLRWSNGSAGVHQEAAQQALRDRTLLGRHSIRLGLELEALRMGVSADRFTASTMSMDTVGQQPSWEGTCYGIDIQYAGRISFLGMEAMWLDRNTGGIVVGWTIFPAGWIGLKTGIMMQQGGIPFPEAFSGSTGNLSHATAMHVSTNLHWGYGWEFAGGFLHERELKAGDISESLWERVYLMLVRQKSRSDALRISASLRLASTIDDLSKPGTEIAWLRCLWSHDIHSAIRLNTGVQASLASAEMVNASGLAVMGGMSIYLPFPWLASLEADLAFHSSESADTRAYFWFAGPEGRPMMQTLYNTGWRMSLAPVFSISENVRVSCGLTWRASENSEGVKGRSLGAGFRLALSPPSF